MSNSIFIAVFIVCTVTKDVILVNKIKYKMDRVGCGRQRIKAVLTIIINVTYLYYCWSPSNV